ncbi:aldehyde dehydrogenase [Aureimonas ureilytica]|uniref:aldehyde dehydrogenase (NAD(+)) n=1 Tax=Aureimonas ureilytica TaxID=401562 RepID=A0A175R2Q0_9HYPH|nr:aldehyde dehydrogenase family protein [Aureimonas ureilytica]KTQ84178.1 aldehyde dehydrogenase [Aureimonas ureilytica]
MNDFDLIIGGERHSASRRFPIANPATGDVIGSAPDATLADLDRAVDAARRAFPAWSSRSDEDLAAMTQAVADAIGSHGEELARLLTLEQGKPLNGLGSRWEMGGAKAWADYTATLSLPPKVLQDGEAGRVVMHRRPLGVVGSITPWNFPVMIAVWHVLPALRTGNTVVLKPSPFTPLATLRLVEIVNEILPPGVLNIVTSRDGETNLGAAMAAHPGIRKIVFTGSCATGQRIMQTAAPTMKRLTLEMGGNDAGIVLPDVDAKAIAEGLFWGAFLNNGQTCAAMKRLYVHVSVHDDVCAALAAYAEAVPVGDGLVETNVLGPVQNRMQFDKVKRLVDDAKTRGTVLTGGEPSDGLFFRPTLVAGLRNGDPLVDEEQFGPALPVIVYSDVEDAIRAANDSENGLGGSVWSSDTERAQHVARRMECGSVWINKHGAIQPNAPFGGVKASSFGVEFTEEGLAEYTDIQVVFG